MGNYTIILMFENPRRSRQARNFTENDPKILDLKSSSEQIIFRKLSLGAPEYYILVIWLNGSITLIRAETERYDIVRFSNVTTKSLASGIGS